jgi:Na+/H+-dicarboxylate symporter
VYYITTTLLAVFQGIILVMTIHPGKGEAGNIATAGSSYVGTTEDTMLDLVRYRSIFHNRQHSRQNFIT